MPSESAGRWRTGAWMTLAVVVFLWFGHAAQVVFVPTLLGFYLTLTVLPVHRWLYHRLPRWLRWLSTWVAVLLPVFALAVVGAVSWWAGTQVAEESDQLRQGLQDAWDGFTRWLEGLGLPVDSMVSAASFGSLLDQATTLIRNALSTTLSVTIGLALVLFLVALLLSERDEWVAKTREMLSRRGAGDMFDIADEASENVRLFLLWRTVSGLISATGVSLLTWGLGVPLWPLWALMQWLLNYIPNIGSVIAGIFPVLFAMALVDVRTGLWVFAGVLVIEQFVGNWLDPKLQGRGLRLSPAAVLVALLLFGWVWGIAGALLSAPILATIRAVSLHVPDLRPLAVLLGRHPDEERALSSGAPAK